MNIDTGEMDNDPAIEICRRINALKCAYMIKRHVRRAGSDVLVDGKVIMSFRKCKCGGAFSFKVQDYCIPYGSHDACGIPNGRIVRYQYNWK
ncbi:hypothetical protein BNJ_00259 [Kaumoebavirus]|uniref:hypothetical protein n=1 Tax=Kaumoebavirus TaxID=1859492 RepID=UPI0009C2A310|nr:hypothetical protein BNJ_00259 [Kaumoebavirus]ARA72084.1 hypothetical protein BNJ_00259 [Kaumoebavirus]